MFYSKMSCSLCHLFSVLKKRSSEEFISYLSTPVISASPTPTQFETTQYSPKDLMFSWIFNDFDILLAGFPGK